MRKNIAWLIVWAILGTGSVYGSYFWFMSQKDDMAISLSPLPSSSPQTTPFPEPFSLDSAPSRSLVATISARVGEVMYISRTATQAAELTKDTLGQGESVLTGADGQVFVQFSASVSARLSSASHINFIQTLPHSIVLEQQAGTVKYLNFADTPLSIRVKRLIMQVSQAEISVTYDEIGDVATISVLRGEVTLAYNNATFVSQVQHLSAGQSAVFDNAKRKLIIR